MFNRIRLKLANMIRWIPGTGRICDWLAPILTVGQDASILDISENMLENEEIDKKLKKKMAEAASVVEYEPYDEEEKETPFEHVTVSTTFLGLGTIPVKDEIGIKARNFKPRMADDRLIAPPTAQENEGKDVKMRKEEIK